MAISKLFYFDMVTMHPSFFLEIDILLIRIDLKIFILLFKKKHILLG